MFMLKCVFVLVLSTVLVQSDAYHAVVYEVGDLIRETSPEDQQDTETSLEDQHDDVSLSNQQYDLDEEEEEYDDVSPPDGGEEIRVTVSPLSNMEENGVSASVVWVLFLAVPMVLLVVMSSLAVVYYLFVWRGGRMGYKAQRDLLYKT